MENITIWHNPRCSKSRAALKILLTKAPQSKIVRYLDEPPSVAELERVLGLLGLEPRELMRKNEAPYGELGLGQPGRTRAELLSAMFEHPILIERPIVIAVDRAIVGRPPERVLELF